MKTMMIRNLDDVMDAVFGDLSGPALRTVSRTPAVDVREEDTRYVLEADIPGFDESDVEIKVDGQLLTLSAKAAARETKEGDTWVLRERRAASFCRSFSLPRDVDLEAISASAAKGVLTIVLPKHPKAQPRTIAINAQ